MIKYDYASVKDFDGPEDFFVFQPGFNREDALKVLREDGPDAVIVDMIDGDGDIWANMSNRCADLHAQRSVYKDGVLKMLEDFDYSDTVPFF